MFHFYRITKQNVPSLVHQILAITHPYVEYLEENITKWYILVPGILIVLNVLTTLHQSIWNTNLMQSLSQTSFRITLLVS